jgi:integrase
VSRVFRPVWEYPKRSGKFRKSEHWFMEYEDASGKMVREKIRPPTTDRKLAEKALTRREGEVLDGTLRARARSTTLEQVLKHWESKRLSDNPRSFARKDKYDIALVRDAIDCTAPAETLVPGDVRSAIGKAFAARGGGQKANTRRAPLVLMKAALNLARADGLIRANPLRDMPIPMEKDERHVVWTADELTRVLKRLPPLYRKAALLSLLTSLRKGDVLSLSKASVRSGELHAKIQKAGGRSAPPRPVTEQIDAIVASLMPGPSPWLFPSPRDPRHHLERTSGARFWKKALEDEGLAGARRFHDLRRTGGQTLRTAGIADQVIANALDHSSTKMVSRYTRVEQDVRDAAFRLISARFSQVVEAVLEEE